MRHTVHYTLETVMDAVGEGELEFLKNPVQARAFESLVNKSLSRLDLDLSFRLGAQDRVSEEIPEWKLEALGEVLIASSEQMG